MVDKRIVEYVQGDRITAFFAVRRVSVRDYHRGQFVSLELGDATGRIAGVQWDPDQFSLTELQEGQVVKIKGTVGEYMDRPQLVVEKMRLALDGEYDLNDILPHSPIPLDQRRARILALVERVQNTWVRQLLDAFFGDEGFLDRYLQAAAGKLWHHAYVGGLSEHSANVTELAIQVAAGYDFLDRDLLIFGGLMHDAGKIGQYDIAASIDYTDEGRLVGHINMADAWICHEADQIENFPNGLLMKLRHMILSHHGELQYGAPVVPQMPEAFILYYCDEIDSKMGAIARIRTKSGGEGWSEFVKMLDRHLYFGEGSGE